MKPELAPYADEIATLVAFVEGRISGDALETALHTPAMQMLLGLYADPRYPALTNDYRRLTAPGRERTDLKGLAASEDVVVEFLNKAELPFQPVLTYGKQLQARWDLEAVLPEWLDLSSEFIQTHLLPADETLSAAKRKAMAKQQVKALFRCAKKPPRWIQNPEWPLDGDVPAVFVGQLPIEDAKLFHDNGAAYLFFHPQRGEFETVVQFY